MRNNLSGSHFSLMYKRRVPTNLTVLIVLFRVLGNAIRWEEITMCVLNKKKILFSDNMILCQERSNYFYHKTLRNFKIKYWDCSLEKQWWCLNSALGRSHILRRIEACVPQLLSLCSGDQEPQLLKPVHRRAWAGQQERSPALRRITTGESPLLSTTREKPKQQQRPSIVKNK